MSNASAIVVGLGAFGADVGRRLARERAALPEREPITLVVADREIDPRALAKNVGDCARDILSHTRQRARRDSPGADGQTQLHIFVVGHLGEVTVRDHIEESLREVERELFKRFAPIFERYRTHDQRNLVVLPMLAMPHPASHERGTVISNSVRELARSVAQTPPRERAVPQIYIIEDVAEFSVLSDHELGACVRNFATLMLESLDAVPHENLLLFGRQPNEPLATFVCAVAELPRANLRRYAVNRVALELLDAVHDAPRDTLKLSELDLLEEVELAALTPDDESDEDVRALLERYAPDLSADAAPRWFERGEDVAARYGPDLGDPSLDAAFPPASPPIGFALEKMEAVEASWRLLQRRRFDDVIAKERKAIEEARDALLERVHARVDREMFESLSPTSFRKAAELVTKMRRGVSERLERAVRLRDETTPAPPPSFDAFRDSHASLLDEARRKLDLPRVVVYGALVVAASIALLPTLLWALADLRGVPPGSTWWEPWLRQRGHYTGALVGLLLFAVPMGIRFHDHVERVMDRWRGRWRDLADTMHADRDSVQAYFATRLRLARRVARVEALLAVESSLARDEERLTLLDRAVRRARATLLEENQRLGVVRKDGRDNLSGLCAVGQESLVEPLIAHGALASLSAALPAENREARIRDLLDKLAREHQYQSRWREEVPFTAMDTLRAAAESHAAPLSEWDPFADPLSADVTADRIARFVRGQARSLKVALNFTGHESRDPTGVTHAMRGEAIVPPAALKRVARLLQDEGAAGRQIPLHEGSEADRAYYVVAVADIAAAAIPSLSGGLQGELLFEIERGSDR